MLYLNIQKQTYARAVHFIQILEKKINQNKIMLYMNSQYNHQMYVRQLGAVINNRTINSNKENQQSTSWKVDETESNHVIHEETVQSTVSLYVLKTIWSNNNRT